MHEILQIVGKLHAFLAPKERHRVAILCVVAVIAAAVEALSIGAVFPFIVAISAPETLVDKPFAGSILNWLGHPSSERIALFGAAGLLILYATKNTLLAFFYAFQSRIVCEVESRLGTALLAAYLQAPYTERLAHNSADRIRTVTNDVGRVTIGVMMGLISLFSEALVVLAISVLLVFAQPVLAAFAFLVVAVVGTLMQTIFQRKLDRYKESRVTSLSGMIRWVTEGLGALKEIKVLGRENYVVSEFHRSSQLYAHGTFLFTTLGLMPRLVFETAAISAFMLSVIVIVLAGNPLSAVVPALTVFAVATIRLLPSASRIVASLAAIRFYAPAVNIVAADVKLIVPAGSIQAEFFPRNTGRFDRMRLNNVSYRYRNSESNSLVDVTFELLRGETIGISGRSGSGKTTLIDLLLGLLSPTSGTIEINGQPAKSLRQTGMAGLVPQEIFMLDDTVRRNVGFGLPDETIDDARVWRVLAVAKLDARIRALPQQLDTPVGERGAALSGGERQRLGIARALYADPEILILDEATSALDEKTEEEFLSALRSLHGQKTIIVISHRPASIEWCNRSIILDGGRIVADQRAIPAAPRISSEQL